MTLTTRLYKVRTHLYPPLTKTFRRAWGDCYSTADREAEYCDERVCLSGCVCVCLSVHDHIFGTTRSIFTKFF